MTDREAYEARIEAVARAMHAVTPYQGVTGAHIGLPDSAWRIWIDQARAADAACLKALEEPTEKMCQAAFVEASRVHGNDHEWLPHHLAYRTMHAAIPRGDK